MRVCTSRITSTKHFLTSASTLMRSMAVNLDCSAALIHLFWMYFKNSLSSGTFIIDLNTTYDTHKFSSFRCLCLPRTGSAKIYWYLWNRVAGWLALYRQIPLFWEVRDRVNQWKKNTSCERFCQDFRNQIRQLWSWGRSRMTPSTVWDRLSTAHRHRSCLTLFTVT